MLAARNKNRSRDLRPRRHETEQWEATYMTTTDLTAFRELLTMKRAELSASRGLEQIAIERSADLLEEVQYKSERELAIAGLNRESAIRRSIELALARIKDHSFGTCVHCDEEIGRRRLQAVPWSPFCIRCQEAADRGDEGVLESAEPTLLDAA
jgi:DnaK suppressor protein